MAGKPGRSHMLPPSKYRESMGFAIAFLSFSPHLLSIPVYTNITPPMSLRPSIHPLTQSTVHSRRGYIFHQPSRNETRFPSSDQNSGAPGNDRKGRPQNAMLCPLVLGNR
ncbi:hypothetical protein EJ04DRAFT_512593 [Polyplosphaeria fusca]|uniref:Uncharacterized protein n=1 Tax=Polyplosphaeria fusca TaxID=682080 RepID=A0A9P4R0A6_9PLEO|nr:hypothetical protein EJ04DRAFT_512593 [Polyplosphaeria fusca]